jgi:hypothetical protein
MLTVIETVIKDCKPRLNGEILLTGEEVMEMLHLSKRSLQSYRDTGIIPFIQIGGKILYRETDILKLLDKNYYPAFE